MHAGDASSLFMHPGTVFMAHFMGGDDLAEAIGPLLGDLKQHLVFVPINNNSEAEASGGSHWSLLVFIRATNELWHYDSSPGSGNGAAARRIADNLGPLLAGNGERAPSESPVAARVRVSTSSDVSYPGISRLFLPWRCPDLIAAVVGWTSLRAYLPTCPLLYDTRCQGLWRPAHQFRATGSTVGRTLSPSQWYLHLPRP